MTSPPVVAKQPSWPASLIKQLRGKRTQAEFGRLLGVPKNTVWRWEAAQVVPNPEHQERLSELADQEHFESEWTLAGSMIILGDIEEASKEISHEIQEGLERSARLLLAED